MSGLFLFKPFYQTPAHPQFVQKYGNQFPYLSNCDIEYICVPKMIYRYKRNWSDRNELKAYTTSHYFPKDEIQAMEKTLVNYPLNNLNISFHSCPETSSRRFATTLQQSLQVRWIFSTIMTRSDMIGCPPGHAAALHQVILPLL